MHGQWISRCFSGVESLGKEMAHGKAGTSFGSVGMVAMADGVGKSLAWAQFFSDQLRLRVR